MVACKRAVVYFVPVPSTPPGFVAVTCRYSAVKSVKSILSLKMYPCKYLDASRPVWAGILSEIRLYHLCDAQVLQQRRPSAQFSLVPPGQLTGNAQRPQGNVLLPLMSSHSSPWFFNPPEGSEGLFLFFRGFPLRPECNKTTIMISLDQK